ncbi:MAG TPA: (Fe-S)-binding protein [Syntrophomonadaceae bacterium]|nr:(Fe-S)-binding protein [Syntrophomonadaceae bacterium]
MNKESDSLYSTLEKEALICARCGYCRDVCPIYKVLGWESATPRGKISMAREIFSKNQGENLSEDFVKRVSQCTLCGACGTDCSTCINTRKLWLDLRKRIATMGKEPKAYDAIKDNLLVNKNITTFSNDDRLEWAQDLDDPEALEPRAGAEVCYFVGCVSSFFPQAAQIPLAVAEILTEAEIDFITMGGEEWCCGFPLISTGFVDNADQFIQHNAAKIKELDIHTLIASCASCYHVWKHDSAQALQGYELEVLHTTEYLARLIKEGKIELNELDEVVTYHDPCDLGRNGGVYDAPREIIKAIPGVTFVELQHHHEKSLCCGGGGNLQSVDPGTAARITELRLEEIKTSGATIIVSACQQCEQMLITAIQKAKLPIRVLDVSQLILEAMG